MALVFYGKPISIRNQLSSANPQDVKIFSSYADSVLLRVMTIKNAKDTEYFS